MALLTALCFSIYAVLVRHNRQVDMLPAILISTFFIMVVVALVRYDALQISRGDLLLCMLWGGVMSGFTSVCFIVASRHIAAAELTIFMLLEFALGPIWVWLFYQRGAVPLDSGRRCSGDICCSGPFLDGVSLALLLSPIWLIGSGGREPILVVV